MGLLNKYLNTDLYAVKFSAELDTGAKLTGVQRYKMFRVGEFNLNTLIVMLVNLYFKAPLSLVCHKFIHCCPYFFTDHISKPFLFTWYTTVWCSSYLWVLFTCSLLALYLLVTCSLLAR